MDIFFYQVVGNSAKGPAPVEQFVSFEAEWASSFFLARCYKRSVIPVVLSVVSDLAIKRAVFTEKSASFPWCNLNPIVILGFHIVRTKKAFKPFLLFLELATTGKPRFFVGCLDRVIR